MVLCIFLIAVVLLQTGKGADMGAVFGGGSQTLFGSGGAGNVLTRLTTGMAIGFMVTSLILTYGSTRMPTSDLIDRLPLAPAPATPPLGDAAPGPGATAEPPSAAGEPAPIEAAPPAAEAPAGEPAPATR
ncbi:MAG: preprotein translocase subunit SecG [Chloroflexi bacterium]|nr:preprotein translocase subunit SecG [Chloroflexota bacterium]